MGVTPRRLCLEVGVSAKLVAASVGDYDEEAVSVVADFLAVLLDAARACGRHRCSSWRRVHWSQGRALLHFALRLLHSEQFWPLDTLTARLGEGDLDGSVRVGDVVEIEGVVEFVVSIEGVVGDPAVLVPSAVKAASRSPGGGEVIMAPPEGGGSEGW